MRLSIRGICQNLQLPINHRLMLQAMIYNNLSECLAKHIHDDYEHQIKKFTFSKILGNYHIAGNKITFNGNITFIIASDNIMLLNDFYNHLIQNDYFILNDQPILVDDIKINDFKITKNIVTYRTLSPVTIYKTNEDNYTEYLGPYDNDYAEAIYNNLLVKAELDNFDFEILDIKNIKRGVYKYKEFNYEAYDYIITIKTDPFIHNIIMNNGLGSRNAIGFGMMEIYNEK